MLMLEQRIQQQFFDSADLKYQTAETLSRPLSDAAAAMHGAILAGGKVMLFGSGQAASLAAHGAGLLVGRFERERPPLAALAADGLDPLRALGQPGDVLLVLDGGDADTAAAALDAAHEKDMTAVVMAATSATTLRDRLGEADVLVAVPHERMARVMELQLLALHILCDAIDLQLMGEQVP